MSRLALFVLAATAGILVAGCATSEIKNTNAIGLSKDIPTGTIQSGYGDGKGDSVGGGGAAAPRDADHKSTPVWTEVVGH